MTSTESSEFQRDKFHTSQVKNWQGKCKLVSVSIISNFFKLSASQVIILLLFLPELCLQCRGFFIFFAEPLSFYSSKEIVLHLLGMKVIFQKESSFNFDFNI